MNPAKILVVHLCASFACLTLTAVPLKPANPTVNHTKWVKADVRFHPLDITAVGSRLWSCGTQESVAVSDDAGMHWMAKNQSADGEALLQIRFVSAKIAHAAGTHGRVLTTSDGGEHWMARGDGSTIREFSFSDALHGVAIIDKHIQVTGDGGDSWDVVDGMQTDDRIRPFSEIESVAAQDATHFAVAVHQPEGENLVVSTTDAGRSLTPLHIPDTFAHALFVRDGEYWAFGIEYLGREHNPGGGYGAPLALHSADAQHWAHGVRATNEFDACNEQGCGLTHGVIESVYGNQEKIYSVPQDRQLSPHWAMTGSTVCMVSGGLWCGSALPSPAPQPPAGTYLSTVATMPQLPDCVDCPVIQIGGRDAAVILAGRPFVAGRVTAVLDIAADGTVTQATVKGLPPGQSFHQVHSQLLQWALLPERKGGANVSTERSIDFALSCFAPPPGIGEDRCDIRPAH